MSKKRKASMRKRKTVCGNERKEREESMRKKRKASMMKAKKV